VSTLNIGDASLRPDITVSDGANFYFEGGQFRVGPSSYGVVTIEATTTGVTFSSAQTNPAAGDWGGLYFGGDADDSILEGVTVEYAGSGAASVYITQTKNLTFSDCTIENGGAAGLYGTGSADMSITDCSISDHASYGLRIDNAELNADFTNNTVSGNGEEPLYIHPEYLRYLDSTSTFTGNTTDAILVDGGTVSTSGTWPLLDVDYNVVGDVTVNATGAPHIVVEDGTTWSFDSTASLRVHLASIEAVGTSTSGITLTSSDAAPAAGDWQGLVLGGNCTPSKVQLDYVTVAYAGGTASGNSDTAIYWACDGGTISNSTISDSGGWGIYRWYATPTITSVSYSNTPSGDLY
jgi:hypothetical protein